MSAAVFGGPGTKMITEETLSREIAAVQRAVGRLRAPTLSGEYDLHALLAGALAAEDIDFVHEYRLAPRCRIDFKAGAVGIEVKKGRPDARALTAQLSRYLASEELSALVVVMQRAVSLPQRIAGKPVVLISLNRLWGVALP